MNETNEPITGEIPTLCRGQSDRTIRLRMFRDIAGYFVAAFALCVTALVIVDKNATETTLREEIAEFRSEERQIDLIERDKAECRRRYEAITDANGDEQLNLLIDYVILARTDDPDRDRKMALKAEELEAINITAREDEGEKIEYDNLGNPLPCPIGPSVLPAAPTAGG